MIDPVQQNFDVVRHEDLRVTFVFTTEGRPIDITGWLAKMAIADAPGGTAVLTIDMAANSNGSRFTIKSAAGGVLELYINKADNAALPTATDIHQIKTFAYDVLVTGGADGDTNRYFFGNYAVEPGVAS